ncbi:hypothetical protein N6B35_29685 (plasmid) [Klebsiella michiganensis]|uniref:hypothetical protein n=1 Tax=Klebsiella michiganensis TaxID=1134687 RepID=UPI0021DB705A|nr:hypothetical protein [Klebsiella michiganensis]UYB60074.1 hypothetical protein N6B35_29685 [Klebsiella michiganensis]
MLASGTRKAELARLMGMKGQQIDRLLDVTHSSKVETVELALRQLNRVVQLTVDKVAAYKWWDRGPAFFIRSG